MCIQKFFICNLNRITEEYIFTVVILSICILYIIQFKGRILKKFNVNHFEKISLELVLKILLGNSKIV